MMQFLEAELRRVSETVWESGALTIACSAELAWETAETMSSVDSCAASPFDTQATIEGLANMAGGHVMTPLPKPCRLLRPMMVEGAEGTAEPHGGERAATVVLDWQGPALVVRLSGKAESDEV
jgi:hypothetical protein